MQNYSDLENPETLNFSFPARLLSLYGVSPLLIYYPLLSGRMPSRVEVCSLSRAKDFSSGLPSKYLRGQPQAHNAYSNILPNLVFLPGHLFAGTREGVGGRNNCKGCVDRVHAKAGFRMVGLRSICTPLIVPLSSDHARLTEENLTVNSDAHSKCLISRYSRRYTCPSEHRYPERMD
jgi:hypothetical protein